MIGAVDHSVERHAERPRVTHYPSGFLIQPLNVRATATTFAMQSLARLAERVCTRLRVYRLITNSPSRNIRPVAVAVPLTNVFHVSS